MKAVPEMVCMILPYAVLAFAKLSKVSSIHVILPNKHCW